MINAENAEFAEGSLHREPILSDLCVLCVDPLKRFRG